MFKTRCICCHNLDELHGYYLDAMSVLSCVLDEMYVLSCVFDQLLLYFMYFR